MVGELTRQELLKLATQRFPYVLVAAVMALQTIATLVAANTNPETSLDVTNGAWVFATGAQAGVRGAVFVILVIGSMSLSREFSLGTAKTFLLLPVSRSAWVTSKLIALVIVALALVVLIFTLGIALTALQPGWGAVRQEGLVLVTGGAVAQSVAAAAGLTAALMVPVCAFALLIGLHFTSSGAAVGIAVLLGVMLEAAANLIDPLNRYVFLAWVPRPLVQLERMAKGMPYEWNQLSTWGLGIAALSFMAMVGWIVFRLERMDIPG